MGVVTVVIRVPVVVSWLAVGTMVWVVATVGLVLFRMTMGWTLGYLREFLVFGIFSLIFMYKFVRECALSE